MTPLQQRQARLRQRLAEIGVEGMLFTNLTSVRYLSGFTGSAGVLLILAENGHFISDGRYGEQARLQVPDFQIHIDAGTRPGGGSGLLELVRDLGLMGPMSRLAFEADHVAVSSFSRWGGLFPAVQWVETSAVAAELAMIKDADELAALGEAVRITDKVFEALLGDIRPGAVERQVAARISYLVKHHGGEADSFEPIVASGWRGALPHARPSDKAFERGDFVVLDFGARYSGYHADMTRTVCVSEATDRQREVYGTVLEAQLRGIAAARAGIATAAVDAACRDYIEAKGFGEYFVHATGHGLGLEVHTPPRLSRQSGEVLAENMAVTVEPGIYIPDWGGVRIEDDILVGPDGSAPLNKSTKELLVLG